MRNKFISGLQKQTGAVLILSLVMLFTLTLIGVSTLNTTNLEEKMAGNTRDRHIAFQAAESAIRAAEEIILEIDNPEIQFVDDGTKGRYSTGNGPTTANAIDDTWWSSNNTETHKTNSKNIKTEPVYVIEYLAQKSENLNILGGQESGGEEVAAIRLFRITARGTGLTDNSTVVIQTTFGKEL